MKIVSAKTTAGITDLPTVPDGRSLLAVGCSYTNEYFKSKAHPEMDCSFTKWPTILGSQLGFDNVVNLGKSGNSNDAIFKQTQDYIIDNNNKVDMICVLWTTVGRLNVHDMSNINWNATYNSKFQKTAEGAPKTTYPGKIEPKDPFTIKTMRIFNLEKFTDIVENNWIKLIHEHLRNIFMLNQFSRYNNIPIYHMQGVPAYVPYLSTLPGPSGPGDSYPDWMEWYYPSLEWRERKRKEYLKALMRSKYFNILEEQTNIWGWPFERELAGTHINSEFTEEHIISEKDKHPNAKGHQLIASKFMEIINENTISSRL
tara:strand:+ start:468 stop:1409 length:942 start_codon:yes stop_codon:yes gene_type:complete